MIKIYQQLFIVSLAMLWLSACVPQKKQTNWSLSFSKDSKDPYGTYLSYQALTSMLHQQPVTLNSGSRLANLGYRLRKQGGTSFICMVGNGFYPDKRDVDSLFSMIAQGHQVLLAANNFDSYLLDKLDIISTGDYDPQQDTTVNVFLLSDKKLPIRFTHDDKGLYLRNCFKNKSQPARYLTLGTTEKQTPNFIVYKIGNGHLLLHASPMVFSNYFLLQGNNKHYLEQVFSYIPNTIDHIYWSDFMFKRNSHSDWRVLWEHPATKTALLLSLLGLLVYILFEIKRKQKAIPVLPPVENASVAFVETIGRLYYNKKNHHNLAEKMVQHFLEYVRHQYYLNTSQLDKDFIKQLAAKSGQSIAATDSLIYTIKEVLKGVNTNDQYLYALYSQIQLFTHGGK